MRFSPQRGSYRKWECSEIVFFRSQRALCGNSTACGKTAFGNGSLKLQNGQIHTGIFLGCTSLTDQEATDTYEPNVVQEERSIFSDRFGLKGGFSQGTPAPSTACRRPFPTWQCYLPKACSQLQVLNQPHLNFESVLYLYSFKYQKNIKENCMQIIHMGLFQTPFPFSRFEQKSHLI